MKKLIHVSCVSMAIFLFYIKTAAQETQIQFPYLNFHMQMNDKMQPSVSYNVQTDIVVGDKSGIVFGLGVAGNDIQNFQGSISDIIQLDNLKLSIRPASAFEFHVFYGRYQYLGQDKVIPRGFQYFQTPGTAYYGYRTIRGAGMAMAFPTQEGRYEPQLIVYSDNFQGVTYFNTDSLIKFRFEKFYIDLYLGVAAPSIGIGTASSGKIGFRFGTSIMTALSPANFYFAFYIPAHYGEKFSFDDIYFRFSEHLLIKGFEQTFSIMSLDSESDTSTNPFVGYNGTPDLNIYLSLGGRIKRIGFGVDYSFIYGLYQQSISIGALDHLSHRFGTYVDFKFFDLTYKLGLFYTLPNSPAYAASVSKPGDIGFYISIFGDA